MFSWWWRWWSWHWRFEEGRKIFEVDELSVHANLIKPALNQCNALLRSHITIFIINSIIKLCLTQCDASNRVILSYYVMYKLEEKLINSQCSIGLTSRYSFSPNYCWRKHISEYLWFLLTGHENTLPFVIGQVSRHTIQHLFWFWAEKNYFD